MHDGRFGSLSAVVDHYRSGVQASPTLDPLLQQDGRLGIAISDAEKNDLIAFMRTLADSSFISNYELSEFAQ
jgi:cytochrome c peroxidase